MRARSVLGLLGLAVLSPLALPAGAYAVDAPNDIQLTGYSTEPAISGDGRYVVFTSQASDLVIGDTNGVADVFVRDLRNGSTSLVSVTPAGTAGSAVSGEPSITNGGRFVVFASRARDLAPGAGADGRTLFVRDLVAKTTRVVPVPTLPVIWSIDSPKISGNGRFVAYDVNAPFHEFEYVSSQVYRTDLTTGRVDLVSATGEGEMGDDGSKNPSISDSGTLVAFASAAPNLNGGFAGAFFIYLKDMATGAVRAVGASASENNPGGAPPVRSAMSGPGRDLVYQRQVFSFDPLEYSFRGPVVVTDLRDGGERELGVSPDVAVSGTALNPSISDDGTYVAFDSDTPGLVPDDLNGTERDVFRTDLRTGKTMLVAAHADGPSMSDNGRWIAYVSSGHVWRRDLRTGTTRQLDVALPPLT